MTIIYKADDGTEFITEKECLAYENRISFDSILFFDKDNHLISYTNPLDFEESEKLYFLATRVHILNEEDFKKFSTWAREFGWCEFDDDITSAGVWVRKTDEMGNASWKWLGR